MAFKRHQLHHIYRMLLYTPASLIALDSQPDIENSSGVCRSASQHSEPSITDQRRVSPLHRWMGGALDSSSSPAARRRRLTAINIPTLGLTKSCDRSVVKRTGHKLSVTEHGPPGELRIFHSQTFVLNHSFLVGGP